LEQVLVTFQALVQERVAELQVEASKNAIHMPELRKEREQKTRDASGIADVIAMMGRNSSPILLSRLQATELRIREIDELLARAKEPEPMAACSGDETKEYLVGKLRDLQTVLTTSPQVGRQILQKQIRKITLRPGEAGSKRVFHVAVEFSCGDGG